jgi:hypothetical protein
MIFLIFSIGLLVWCIYNRTKLNKKVEGQPLGMPRGTVRALITISIVTFPFTYLLTGAPIPGLITNALFILVAFYFEARKGGQDKVNRIIKLIREEKKTETPEAQEWKPLYLPKYTVRILLIVILLLVVLINSYGPNVAIQATNTLADIFIIIILFLIGTFFRLIGISKERKHITTEIHAMQDFRNQSKYEIFEKLIEEKPSWWAQKGKSFLSLFTFSAVMVALMLYSLNLDPPLLNLGFYDLTLRAGLLLFVNVYYGLRD